MNTQLTNPDLFFLDDWIVSRTCQARKYAASLGVILRRQSRQVNLWPGGLWLGVTGNPFFEQSDDLGAALPMPLGLLGIIAEDIAPSAFAITDDGVFGMKVVPDDIVSISIQLTNWISSFYTRRDLAIFRQDHPNSSFRYPSTDSGRQFCLNIHDPGRNKI